MTSLFSNFFIQPVLRQARRFSRSVSADDDAVASNYVNTVVNIVNIKADSATSLKTTTAMKTFLDHHEIAEEELERGEKDMQSTTDATINLEAGEGDSLSGQTIVASPLESPSEELPSVEDEIPEETPWNRSNTEPAARITSRLPIRLASLRSEYHQINDDMSANASFGTPSGFRTTPQSSMSIPNPTSEVRLDTMDEGSDMAEEEASSYHTHQRAHSLPEDDGMSDLRRRIVTVQKMDSTPEEKARLMHYILTESYSQSRGKPIPRTPSPTSVVSQDIPTTPSSPSSFGIWPMSRIPNSPPTKSSDFRLTMEDLRRTYAPPKPPRAVDDEENINLENDNDQVEENLEPSLGCPHYMRNVKLQCSQCHRWYTCRFCHDEVEDHSLIRKETKNMLCMICGTPQAAGQTCIQCGEQAAWYYCSVCKLWDDDTSKSIYHCDDCGICRIGRGLGKDYIHCKTCGACMAIAIENSHKCIERSTDCDCPICGDYMFSSPQTVVFMRCGHSIHRKCYTAHMQTSYKCPICSRSVINMETQFRNLDRAIDNQPMPPQFRDTKAMVHCNDCYAKSAVRYHWLGLKCAICDSYNTAQLQILTAPEEAADEVEGIVEAQVDGPGGEEIQSLTTASYHLAVPPSQRIRRHSNINIPPPRLTQLVATSPQHRMSRSTSPARAPLETLFLRNRGVGRGGVGGDGGSEVLEEAEEREDGDDGDYGEGEDEVGFWGFESGESRRDRELIKENRRGDGYDDDEYDDEDDEEEEEEEDEDEDEGEDRMQLFGHR